MIQGWYVREPPLTGVMAVQLKKAVVSAFGSMATSGTFSPSLKKLSIALAGESPPYGSLGVELKKVGTNFVGAQEIPGSFAMALKKIGINISYDLATGPMAVTLKKAQVAFAGEQAQVGTIATELKKVQISALGVMQPSGTLAVATKKLQVALAGEQAQVGSFAILSKKVQMALGGTHEQAGTMAIGLKKININLLNAQPVAYDAIGPGTSGFNGFIGTAGGSWNHPVTAGLNNVAVVMIFDVRYGGQTRAGQTTFTVTLGGVQMTLLGFAQVNSENSVEMWGALNVGTGNKAMVLSIGNTGAFTGRGIIARSFSYANVGSFGVAATNTGGSTTPSASYSAGPPTSNDMVICGYGAVSQAITAATGGNQRVVNINSGDNFAQMAAADAVGANPTPFGGTISSSTAWGTVADRLIAA